VGADAALIGAAGGGGVTVALGEVTGAEIIAVGAAGPDVGAAAAATGADAGAVVAGDAGTGAAEVTGATAVRTTTAGAFAALGS
jgi:hypothetical protein